MAAETSSRLRVPGQFTVRRLTANVLGRRGCHLLLAGVLALSGALNAQAADDAVGKMVVNSGLKSNLLAGRERHSLNGRLSAHLRASESDIKQGIISVYALNIVYFDVPQPLITGLKPRGKETGALGFTIDLDSGGQFLRYNPYQSTIEGTITGQVSIPQFAELDPDRSDRAGHDIATPTQEATVVVRLELDKPIDIVAASEGIVNIDGTLKADIDVFASPELGVRDYMIATPYQGFESAISWLHGLEVSKRLCLQPVRIGVSGWNRTLTRRTYHYTGDGLSFGLPEANFQWSKAQVEFQVRPFITIWKSRYWSLSDDERSDLLQEVQTDDCIEIFFVDNTDSSPTNGGGMTYGGGLESSQIISSDENADHGIDLTHLAHELGHVMTLKHPEEGFPNDSYPYRVDGSTGTLMCGSGFMNDNPQINSQWNKDYINNPLFTFSLMWVFAALDCEGDTDCGPCP